MSAIGNPMLAVSALLPELPQDDIRRLMNGLELSVGNGFHDVPRTVTWEMLDDMRRRGFLIGSHTRSHVSLPVESPERMADELQTSKADLEARLGGRIDHFAYPGGHFNQATVEGERRLGERGRLLVRKSGTEALIRIMAESEDEALVASVIDAVAASLRAAGAAGQRAAE